MQKCCFFYISCLLSFHVLSHRNVFLQLYKCCPVQTYFRFSTIYSTYKCITLKTIGARLTLLRPGSSNFLLGHAFICLYFFPCQPLPVDLSWDICCQLHLENRKFLGKTDRPFCICFCLIHPMQTYSCKHWVLYTNTATWIISLCFSSEFC